MTEQVFAVLTGLLKKCYVMADSKEFFENLMSIFNLMPILDFTFQDEVGPHTTLGSDFLTLMIYNLYLAEP